jgi:excisionase family DNA binding protein
LPPIPGVHVTEFRDDVNPADVLGPRRSGECGPGAALPPQRATFLTVAAAARLMCISEMTLYRAIRDDQFPAVRIRGRLIIPSRVIDAMIEDSIDRNGVVDAAGRTSPNTT